MATVHASKSAEIRARLDHPVIDADGHTIEYEPAFRAYLHQVAGPRVLERYLAHQQHGGIARWYRLSPQERLDVRLPRPPWWGLPARNTLDRATAMLPRLLRERLEALGIDFAILYPTQGLFFVHMPDEELRRATCRALNVYHAEIFRDCADRMTPAAVIPMHTPAEAIAELEYAVKELGLKAVMIAGQVRRPIPYVARTAPQVARYALWLDTFGVDSAYDYDPFWAKCVELKVAPAAHSGGMGWGSRVSVSNYMFNHLGHFAAAGEALCRALFMGGVTRRFPALKVAFLEGGVGWACNLFADLVGHWEKRNRQAVEHYNPALLDRELLRELCRRYGAPSLVDRLEQLNGSSPLPGDVQAEALLDEWAACQITRVEEIAELFVPRFYFGCEADDPLTAWAFNTNINPFGARLRAMFSSDIGHWDVPDMTAVLAEAYELVTQGIMTAEDFRNFVFTNPVTLYAETSPAFFKGTAVEAAVEKLLAREYPVKT